MGLTSNCVRDRLFKPPFHSCIYVGREFHLTPLHPLHFFSEDHYMDTCTQRQNNVPPLTHSTHGDSSSISKTKRKDIALQDDILVDVSKEDRVILDNIMQAIDNLGVREQPIFSSYKVEIVPTGYIVRAKISLSDVFELSFDDLFFIQSISPARIESIVFCRTSTHSSPELQIKVLDHHQKVMITSSVSFSCNRKRKFSSVPDP